MSSSQNDKAGDADSTADPIDIDGVGDAPNLGSMDVTRPSSKTPLFEAFNAARYQRQSLIREIQTSNHRTLLSYVAGPGAPVEHDDVLAFVDLLHAVPAGADIDLILHTGGGDIDVTEKLANMLWARIGQAGTLRVIVPDFAKSAGTLLALAADAIVMSDSSELGPIDPQLVRRSASGELSVRGVQHHLDAYQRYRTAYLSDPADRASAMMLAKFEPAEIQAFESVMARARQLSDKHLKEGMFRRGDPGAYTAITSSLLDNRRWLTHSQVIGPREAEEIGLNVDYRDSDDPEWRAWWRLHCLHRLALDPNGARKIFESEPVWLQVS